MFEENKEEAEICTFIFEGVPLMYFGELYFDAQDQEQNRLIFKKALVKTYDAKTDTAKWTKVPTAGFDSLVELDRRTHRGVLVKNIDQKEVSEYKSAAAKLYSNLHLAP